MSLAGTREPVAGVKGSKPDFKRKRLPKAPATPEADDLQEQSSIYFRERNAQMRAKRLKAEMELAFDRSQLIEKRLAIRQLAYLLIGLRRKMLAVPGKLRMKFGDERFPHEMLEATKALVVDALTEVSRLPEAAEPDWLEKLEEEGKWKRGENDRRAARFA